MLCIASSPPLRLKADGSPPIDNTKPRTWPTGPRYACGLLLLMLVVLTPSTDPLPSAARMCLGFFLWCFFFFASFSMTWPFAASSG